MPKRPRQRKKPKPRLKKKLDRQKLLQERLFKYKIKKTKKAETIAKKAEAITKKAFDKERKRVKVEEVFRKKLEDKIAKNVETALEKVQSAKQKMALSSNNPGPKKKQ